MIVNLEVKYGSIITEVDEVTHELMLKKEKLNIGWRKCPVLNHFSIKNVLSAGDSITLQKTVGGCVGVGACVRACACVRPRVIYLYVI